MATSFSPTHLLICTTLFLFIIIFSSSSTVNAGPHHNTLGFIPTRSNPSPCNGSISECLQSSDEFDLDSEINRRILATSSYISYGALSRNNVPCSRRGASYYNCQPGAQANPYNRGCSAITRCRS